MLTEEIADDLGLGAIVFHGGHERRQLLAEVLHLSLQALNVVARLL